MSLGLGTEDDLVPARHARAAPTTPLGLLALRLAPLPTTGSGPRGGTVRRPARGLGPGPPGAGALGRRDRSLRRQGGRVSGWAVAGWAGVPGQRQPLGVDGLVRPGRRR